LPVHGGTSRGWLSRRGRVLARAGIGVLTFVIDPDLVDEAVGDGLAWEMRLRSLPSRLGVYFVLGLALFGSQPYGQVLRELTAGLENVLAAAGWRVPAAGALTGVRRRVGEKPLESLLRRLCRGPLPGRSPWSHLCGLLAVAWDGTMIDVADSEENAEAFGRPCAPRKGGKAAGTGGCPQMRLVALLACGDRTVLDAAFGPLAGKGTGERALAARLLGTLRAGMLLVCDRGFWSWDLWHAAAVTGAALLWRIPDSMLLNPVRALPDGSYLAVITDPAARRRRSHKNGVRRRRGSPLPPDTSPLPGTTARVIEFTITVAGADGTTRTEPYRLVTTLLDPYSYPAAALAAGYARRWSIELSYRELKTSLRGPGRILRGRTPDLARQELWALLATYQAIRILIARAAAGSGLAPARLSFTDALHAIRRSIIPARDNMTAALTQADTEILASPLPERHGRVWVRAVKQPFSSYPSRTSSTQPITQHTTCTITITPRSQTTRTPASQPAQPPNHPQQPP
jgi:hypothetical protein